jgi:ribonuclease P/MRP protein subunit POP5
MAKIKPSAREKKRYVVYEIKSKDGFLFKDVKKSILDACYRYIGEFGVNKSRLFIIENTYLKNEKRGIFRCTNRQLKDVKECITMIKEIEGKKASIEIIGVSGIIKKAKHKFLLRK